MIFQHNSSTALTNGVFLSKINELIIKIGGEPVEINSENNNDRVLSKGTFDYGMTALIAAASGGGGESAVKFINFDYDEDDNLICDTEVADILNFLNYDYAVVGRMVNEEALLYPADYSVENNIVKFVYVGDMVDSENGGMVIVSGSNDGWGTKAISFSDEHTEFINFVYDDDHDTLVCDRSVLDIINLINGNVDVVANMVMADSPTSSATLLYPTYKEGEQVWFTAVDLDENLSTVWSIKGIEENGIDIWSLEHMDIENGDKNNVFIVKCSRTSDPVIDHTFEEIRKAYEDDHKGVILLDWTSSGTKVYYLSTHTYGSQSFSFINVEQYNDYDDTIVNWLKVNNDDTVEHGYKVVGGSSVSIELVNKSGTSDELEFKDSSMTIDKVAEYINDNVNVMLIYGLGVYHLNNFYDDVSAGVQFVFVSMADRYGYDEDNEMKMIYSYGGHIYKKQINFLDTNRLNANGDLLIGDTLQGGRGRILPKGTAGQVLKSTANGVEWGDVEAGEDEVIYIIPRGFITEETQVTCNKTFEEVCALFVKYREALKITVLKNGSIDPDWDDRNVIPLTRKKIQANTDVTEVSDITEILVQASEIGVGVKSNSYVIKHKSTGITITENPSTIYQMTGSLISADFRGGDAKDMMPAVINPPSANGKYKLVSEIASGVSPIPKWELDTPSESKTMVVRFSYDEDEEDEDVFLCDKTFNQISEAIDNGYVISAVCDNAPEWFYQQYNGFYILDRKDNEKISFYRYEAEKFPYGQRYLQNLSKWIFEIDSADTISWRDELLDISEFVFFDADDDSGVLTCNWDYSGLQYIIFNHFPLISCYSKYESEGGGHRTYLQLTQYEPHIIFKGIEETDDGIIKIISIQCERGSDGEVICSYSETLVAEDTFTVTFTEAENGTITADKTVNEIIAKAKNNVRVIGVKESDDVVYMYELLNFYSSEGSGTVLFGTNPIDPIITMIYKSNTGTTIITETKTDYAKSLIVNFTEDNSGNIVADKTVPTILSNYNLGNKIEGRFHNTTSDDYSIYYLDFVYNIGNEGFAQFSNANGRMTITRNGTTNTVKKYDDYIFKKETSDTNGMVFTVGSSGTIAKKHINQLFQSVRLTKDSSGNITGGTMTFIDGTTTSITVS